MSSNNSKKRLEIKSITYKTTYNLTKPGITKFTTDNIRLLTGNLMDLTKNFNNSKNIRKNSHSNNKSISKQNKKILNKSPNVRLTSPNFATNNNYIKNKGSSTPSVSPLMFPLSQTTKNNNNLKVDINHLISDYENQFNKTLKNNNKNINSYNIHISNLDNNNLLFSQAQKHFCKSVGKETQNLVSKRNFNGILLDPNHKTDNNYLNNKNNNKRNNNKTKNNLNNIIQMEI